MESDPSGGGEQSKINQILSNHIDIDKRFSETQCGKALPLAFAAYQEGLQSHYLAEVHNAKLLQAMSVYGLHARGPASQKYAQLLLDKCTSFWMAGRQMCEELSLTGNHCTNRKHVLSVEDQNGLPVMPHRSAVNFVSACNCGKKQSSRDDPFNLLEANYNFYSEMDEECCRDLERTSVPFHQNVDQRESESLGNLVNLKRQVRYSRNHHFMYSFV